MLAVAAAREWLSGGVVMSNMKNIYLRRLIWHADEGTRHVGCTRQWEAPQNNWSGSCWRSCNMAASKTTQPAPNEQWMPSEEESHSNCIKSWKSEISHTNTSTPTTRVRGGAPLGGFHWCAGNGNSIAGTSRASPPSPCTLATGTGLPRLRKPTRRRRSLKRDRINYERASS